MGAAQLCSSSRGRGGNCHCSHFHCGPSAVTGGGHLKCPALSQRRPLASQISRLIQTSADRIERMSTRLRVLVWIVVVAMVVVWLAAIWFVVFQPGPLPFLPFKLN